MGEWVSDADVLLAQELSPGVSQTMLPATGKTLIDRVLSFRQNLWKWLQGQCFDILRVLSTAISRADG